MIGFILRRLAQAVVVVIGVTLFVFFLEHLIPGNLAKAILGQRASPGAVAAFDRQNGLNHPVVVQYLHFLGQVLRGNLGYSYRLNQSVDSLVAHEVPNDILLVGISLALALAIAIPLGVAQAAKRNKALDHAATAVSFSLYSLPSYCLALLLVAWLSIGLHWFPPEAPQGATFLDVLSDPRALVLPIITLTLVNVALFSRYMRSSAIATMTEEFVKVARSKGLGSEQVIRRHVLRNSLLPVVTLVGLSLPTVLTAGLIIEYVFNFPGVGLTYYNAAVNADYPVMLGITVLVGLTTVLGSLVADLAYAVLDPRVRYA